MGSSASDWSLRRALENWAKFDQPAAEAALAASGLGEEKLKSLGAAFDNK